MNKNFLQIAVAAVVLGLVLWIMWAHHTPPVPVTRIYVETGSMEPVLHINQDYDCIPPHALVPGGPSAPFDKIKVGDILEFDAPWTAKPVAHRAVRKTLDGWVTRGDANGREDTGFVTVLNYRGTVQP